MMYICFIVTWFVIIYLIFNVVNLRKTLKNIKFEKMTQQELDSYCDNKSERIINSWVF